MITASPLSEWMQVLTSFGVLAGLLLVAYEIRQNTDFARAESSREVFAGWTDVSSTELETDIGDVFVRSIESPETLSSQDIFKLSSRYTMVLSQHDYGEEMYRIGISPVNAGLDEQDAEFYFSSKFSRLWFEVNKYWISAESEGIIAGFIKSTPVSTVWPEAEWIKAQLKKWKS